MTIDEALKFLQNHQPMPSDDDLSEELIEEYDKVRNFFIDYPDERCIPLFLKSFGKGDGFGVYQLVEDVIKLFPKESVIHHLIAGLSSSYESVRYWNTEIAANFPDDSLVSELKVLSEDPNEDIRAAAVIALGQIKNIEVKSILEEILSRESDEHIQSLILSQLKGE